MNGSGRVRRRRFFLWLAPVVLASIALPAGRSGAAEEKVPAAKVADGLKSMQQAAGEVAEYAAEDKAKAQKYANEIEPAWKPIEDTVRANDKDAYILFEDAIEGLQAAAKAGDGKKAESAAKALGESVKAYVAKFPAEAAPAVASASPAPDAAPARAAEAAPATAAPAAEAGNATLARTGRMSGALAALAGAAFVLGGLAVIGGARRRTVPIA